MDILGSNVLAGIHDELVKIAASRMDKNINAGRLSHHDFDPKIPKVKIPGGLSGKLIEPKVKKYVREKLRASAEVAPEVLKRRRQLADKTYKAQMLTIIETAAGIIPTLIRGLRPVPIIGSNSRQRARHHPYPVQGILVALRFGCTGGATLLTARCDYRALRRAVFTRVLYTPLAA